MTVLPHVRTSVHPPLSLLAGPQAPQAGPQAPLVGPQTILTDSQAPPADPQASRAGLPTPLAGPQTSLVDPPAGPETPWMDGGWMTRHTEFLPILQDFVPIGAAPLLLSDFSTLKKQCKGTANLMMAFGKIQHKNQPKSRDAS